MTEKNAPTIVEALRHALGVAEDLIHDEYDGTSTLEDILGRLAEDRVALLRAEAENGDVLREVARLYYRETQVGGAHSTLEDAEGHNGPQDGIGVQAAYAKAGSLLAQPHHPTASVEAVARYVERLRGVLCDPDGRVSIDGPEGDLSEIQWCLDGLNPPSDMRTPPVLPRVDDYWRWVLHAEENGFVNVRVPVNELRKILTKLATFQEVALTAQQHPGLGSGGPTEEPDGGRSGSSWSPIESAPKDGTHFIGYGPIPTNDWEEARETYWNFYGEGSQAHAAFKSGKGPSGAWRWSEPTHNWGSSWYPTHWMPLPSPPSVATEATGVVPATTPSAPIPNDGKPREPGKRDQ